MNHRSKKGDSIASHDFEPPRLKNAPLPRFDAATPMTLHVLMPHNYRGINFDEQPGTPKNLEMLTWTRRATRQIFNKQTSTKHTPSSPFPDPYPSLYLSSSLRQQITGRNSVDRAPDPILRITNGTLSSFLSFEPTIHDTWHALYDLEEYADEDSMTRLQNLSPAYTSSRLLDTKHCLETDSCETEGV